MNRAKFERANPCPALFRPSFSPRIIAGNNNQLERRRLPDRSRRALFVGRATPTIENGSRAAPVSTRKSFVSGSTQADPVKRERHGGPRDANSLYAPCDAPFRRSPTMFAKLQI